MTEKEENNQDIENLNIKLNQLNAAYNELKILNHSDAHKETLREGFLVKAGKNTETILKYICKVKNITVTPRQQIGKVNDNKIAMLNDFIFQLKEKGIINEDIHHHLEIIKKWRNRTAHDISDNNGTIEFIKDSTIESVNDSFNYFKNWFFKNYLKDQFDTTSNNYYKNNTIKESNISEIKETADKNPLNIPDYRVLNQSKQHKKIVKRKKNRTIFFIILLFGGIAYLTYQYLIEKTPNTIQAQPVNKIHMNEDQVHAFLIKYFDSSNDLNSDAHEFFSNKVDTFYFRYNVNPTQIDIIKRENIDYLDNKNSIDKVSLYAYSKNDSITHWRFWSDFVCYRPSKRKFQNCKVQLDFGLNTSNKITSIKQIKVGPIHYTKRKPL